MPLKLLTDDLDRIEPFDTGHPVPAWQKKPKRVAVLRLQSLPVNLINQHHFFAVRFFQVQAALVDLDFIPLNSFIGAGEYDVHCPIFETGFIQDALQGSAGPLGVADAFREPWLTDDPGFQQCPAVTGAFHGYRHGAGGQLFDFVETQAEGFGDQAAYIEPPLVYIDIWNIKVDDEIVYSGRGDGIAHGLQRHSPVAQSKLHLFPME